jgi:hypothetical protein
MDARNDLSPRKARVAPRSQLALRGKRRPLKVEKLRGDELPPPDRLPGADTPTDEDHRAFAKHPAELRE